MFIGGQTSSIDMTLLHPIQSSNAGGAIGFVADIQSGVVVAPALAITKSHNGSFTQGQAGAARGQREQSEFGFDQRHSGDRH